MAKFFKNLFSHGTLSSEKKKYSKSKPDLTTEDENKEFSPPYDTKRKLSVSRSGRMKQNLKARGALGKDLFGDETREEKTKIEYHVHGKSYMHNLHNGNTNRSMDNLDLHQSQHSDSMFTGVSEKSTYMTRSSSEKERRKDRNSSEFDSNDKTDMDREIENVFKVVLKETSF